MKFRLVPEDQYQFGGMNDESMPKLARYDEPSDKPMEINTIETEEKPIEEKPVVNRRRIERDPVILERIVKLALKVANTNNYDEELRIKDSYGKSVDGSNLPNLLKLAVTNQKVNVGENEFIRILHESEVNPEWITNENIKNKLNAFGERRNLKRKRSPPPFQPPKPRDYKKSNKNLNINVTSNFNQLPPLPLDDDYDLL